MPELQGYPLHPFRRHEGHVGVAVMLAFIGQKFLVGQRRQFRVGDPDPGRAVPPPSVETAFR